MADASKSSEASKPGDASRAPLLRLGIAGLGTVGAGLIGLIEQQSARLSLTLGRHIRVTAVSAQSRAKNRGFSLEGIWLSTPFFTRVGRAAFFRSRSTVIRRRSNNKKP